MGRRSREVRERRAKRLGNSPGKSGDGQSAGQARTDRLVELEDKLRELSDGEFESAGNLPPEIRETYLEDVLSFESVSSGTSLFQGLEQHGVNLPAPEKLDEPRCIEKITEVLRALAGLRVFLVGFEHMAPREFYSTLYNQTLWEGCYVEKRIPGAMTIIDVSHSMSRSEWRRFMEDLNKSQVVQ
jgi:hypothetical protein